MGVIAQWRDAHRPHRPHLTAVLEELRGYVARLEETNDDLEREVALLREEMPDVLEEPDA